MESELLRRRVKSTSYEPQIAIKIANIGQGSIKDRLLAAGSGPEVGRKWAVEVDSWDIPDKEFGSPDLVLFIEQVLIFTLVIGRWLAPKHDDYDLSEFRNNYKHK